MAICATIIQHAMIMVNQTCILEEYTARYLYRPRQGCVKGDMSGANRGKTASLRMDGMVY
jgi:hypothetical protein